MVRCKRLEVKMAAPTVGDADRKDRGASIEELTMFPPYEDPPKGAFSKITSFLARFSSEGEPSEPATQPLPRHFEGVTSSGLHSGQMSVRSNPPKRAQYRGVPPMQLSRALRDLEDRNSVSTPPHIHTCMREPTYLYMCIGIDVYYLERSCSHYIIAITACTGNSTQFASQLYTVNSYSNHLEMLECSILYKV